MTRSSMESKERDEKTWGNGTRVEREIDGAWFPATILRQDVDGTFQIEYDEDGNRESGVEEDDLRYVSTSKAAPPSDRRKRSSVGDDSLLSPDVSDRDQHVTPTVVLHRRGEFNSTSGYIINGLENNVATGNGLRGIRWLRSNSF